MEEVLVYVKPVCKNTNGTFEYDFFFSDTPEYVWGPDWDVDVPSVNGDITPDSTTYTKIRRVRTDSIGSYSSYLSRILPYINFFIYTYYIY